MEIPVIIQEINKFLNLTDNGKFVLMTFEDDVLSKVWSDNLHSKNPTYNADEFVKKCIKATKELNKKPNWVKYYFLLETYKVDKKQPYQTQKQITKKEWKPDNTRPNYYDFVEALRLDAYLHSEHSINYIKNCEITNSDVNPFKDKIKAWATEFIVPLLVKHNLNECDFILATQPLNENKEFDFIVKANNLNPVDYIDLFNDQLPRKNKGLLSAVEHLPFSGRIILLISKQECGKFETNVELITNCIM